MNKKQRNRKHVQQNKRNRMVNRRYRSTIKTCSKRFEILLNAYEQEENNEKKVAFQDEIKSSGNAMYSILDKSVKKNVIHKNTAARKKSKIGRLMNKL